MTTGRHLCMLAEIAEPSDVWGAHPTRPSRHGPLAAPSYTAAMPAIGDPAPTFTLTDDEGAAVSLADLAGRRVVLYFYPKDDTPGCTTQACALRDGWAEVQALDVVLFGISPDSPASHGKFRAKFDLPYPLLADEGHAVAEAYGVWVEKSMYGKKYMGVERSTFIIGPDGTLEHVLHKVKPGEHLELIVKTLAA